MTSAAKTIKLRSPGFTLLEIVMVLAIASMVMAGAVGLMIFSSDERALREVSGKIELLAKRARTLAILQQTSYALEFREGKVQLLPLAFAGEDASARRRREEKSPTAMDEDRQITLKDELHLSLRRWNSEKWLKTEKTAVHVWRFDPDGLCEPISLRLNLGKSWSEDVFHPLTASIRDSQLEAR
jgi:prepilin-type N-terminal cleavage/methylation domain-containing protein